MKQIKIELNQVKDTGYNIFIKNGILNEIEKIIENTVDTDSYCVIADSNTGPLFGELIADKLKNKGKRVQYLKFPAGERSKSRSQKAELEDQMFNFELDRKSCCIAVGGGVCGDLAGYIAATFLRGIKFIQVPTTLLAQVDSSVGGKTGIDAPAGKNLIGAFHQPSAVIIDPLTLTGLDSDQYLSGMGEIIKHALLFDKEMIIILENEKDALLNRDPELISRLIANNCKLKAEVVQRDETESGLRKILNLGHTIGHAVETAQNFKIPHGLCVMIGIVLEADLAANIGLIERASLETIRRLIYMYYPRDKWPAINDIGELISIMKKDKKNKDGNINFVFSSGDGSYLKHAGDFSFAVDEHLIKRSLIESLG